jgi:hypothetical protein
MLAANDTALKEWAVVCHELAAGRQIVLLRKGGIREPARGFAVEHREFFLFPTYFHENEEELAPGVRAALPEIARSAPPGSVVRFDLYARVEAVIEVPHLEPLRHLDGQHALAWPAVERRFHYRRPGLSVIGLRAWRLPRPLEIPALFRYDGCRSWVTLETALPVTGAEPVLSDGTFAWRLAELHQALGETPAGARAALDSD